MARLHSIRSIPLNRREAPSKRSRSRQRPRRRPPAVEPRPSSPILVGGLAAGATALLAVVIVVTVLLVWPDGSNGGGPSAGEPSGADKEAIESLARRSIEVLPEGEWSSLYDSFTSEFQQRCPRSEFEQGGRDASIELGDDLTTLRFKRLEELSVEGGTAQANIVGEVGGDTEYAIQAAFRKIEDGSWRLAPAPGTSGCAAFNRLDTVGAGS